MASFSSCFPAAVTRTLLALLLLAGRILPVAAQAPGWQSARAVAVATASGTSNVTVTATAVDAAGNVFVTGTFTNSIVLGSTTLTCLGAFDVFVAKFNPVSNQFVWAQRAGGSGVDVANALVVSGSSVYVAGRFGAPAYFGTTTLYATGAYDVFVAKLTDAGSTGSFTWAQRAGGLSNEDATALAVSGSSVYVAGYFSSVTASFGATTLSLAGSEDVFVAKLTDAGSTGSFAWAQRAGGTASDEAYALAVSGSSVYVAGYFGSATAAFGTTTLTPTGSSAGYYDGFVAKLTDAGSSGSFVWAQRAGGASYDTATELAVSGSSVYVAGQFSSPTVTFGAITLSAANPVDLFVAKLSDAGSTGSFVWAQQAGGSNEDGASALAVSGSSVFVAGRFNSPMATFGATTISSAGAYDAYVAKLTDAGSTGRFVWAQAAGGSNEDGASALAVSGTSVYVAGYFTSLTAGFGPATLTNPSGPSLGFLATLTDATLMGNATTQALPPGQLFPNPARYTATLRRPAGAAPAPLALTDAQGRTVRHYPAPAAREVVLDLRGLPAGLYLLRGAGPSQRLVVE